jgi:hypothetical protein
MKKIKDITRFNKSKVHNLDLTQFHYKGSEGKEKWNR